MDLTTEYETNKLLKEAYELVYKTEDLNSSRKELELRLKRTINLFVKNNIDLSWSESNLFESFFQDFLEVIQSMHQLDFSKRLIETDDKHDFSNLIAQSLNIVNQELEEKFMTIDLMPLVLDSLKVNNRIILVSKDKEKINYSYTNINNKELDVHSLQNERLDSIIKKEVISKLLLEEKNILELEGKLNHAIFDKLPYKEAHFNINNTPKYLIITITTYPENKFISQVPRILSFISALKDQFEDNPKAVKSVLGYVNSMEINSIHNELKAYLSEKENPSHLQ